MDFSGLEKIGHIWAPFRLAPSRILRMYHSSALLLPNATVLVSGSNPNNRRTDEGPFPTEFRLELFHPPHIAGAFARPVITSAPAATTPATQFTVTFTATGNGGGGTCGASASLTERFSVCFANPGFSTHSNRHGMRHVWLRVVEIAAEQTSAQGFTAVIAAPPNFNLAPPGYYWLNVLDCGVPSVDAKPINFGALAI